MEKELNQKLEEIAFRLQRLSDDYYVLLKEIGELENVKKSKSVLYEQYILVEKIPLKYFVKSRINDDTIIINYVKSHHLLHCKGKYIFQTSGFELAPDTSKIIETYIPSKNIVLVVELW